MDMDGLLQKTWLPIFVSLSHLILLPLFVLCSGKKSDSDSVAPTQETVETASPSTVGNESGSKVTPEAGPERSKSKPAVETQKTKLEQSTCKSTRLNTKKKRVSKGMLEIEQCSEEEEECKPTRMGTKKPKHKNMTKKVSVGK